MILTHAAAVVPINMVNCEAPWLIGEPGGLASSHHNHLQYHHFSTHTTWHSKTKHNTQHGKLHNTHNMVTWHSKTQHKG